MWKSVSMRIRGAKAELEEAGEETDGIIESTAELRNMVKGMTGFDIMLDDKTFKNMKDIVIGIGKEWKNLSDVNQSALLQALAGKTQANALAAALNNYEMIEEAYKTATEAEGSAMREQAAYAEGLEYRLNRLTAALQELASVTLNSDMMKVLIDGATSAIELITTLIDKFGLLNSAIVAGVGFFGAKGSGLTNHSLQAPFYKIA